MPANTSPIFPLTPKTPITTVLTTANTALDGTGAVVELYTAGANGGYVEQIKIQHLGTNSSATVFRVFLNNGSTNATATNNALLYEETIAANTLSQVAKSVETSITCGIAIQAGYKLYATIGTTITAGVIATCIAGDY